MTINEWDIPNCQLKTPEVFSTVQLQARGRSSGHPPPDRLSNSSRTRPACSPGVWSILRRGKKGGRTMVWTMWLGRWLGRCLKKLAKVSPSQVFFKGKSADNFMAISMAIMKKCQTGVITVITLKPSNLLPNNVILWSCGVPAKQETFNLHDSLWIGYALLKPIQTLRPSLRPSLKASRAWQWKNRPWPFWTPCDRFCGYQTRASEMRNHSL